MNTKSIELKSKLDNYKAETKNLKKALISYIKDDSIPILERWQLFVDSDLGHISNYMPSIKALENSDMMENFDKYATYTYTELVEDYFEYNDEGDLTDIVPDKNEFVTAIMKYAMSSFEKGFIFNW